MRSSEGTKPLSWRWVRTALSQIKTWGVPQTKEASFIRSRHLRLPPLFVYVHLSLHMSNELNKNYQNNNCLAWNHISWPLAACPSSFRYTIQLSVLRGSNRLLVVSIGPAWAWDNSSPHRALLIIYQPGTGNWSFTNQEQEAHSCRISRMVVRVDNQLLHQQEDVLMSQVTSVTHTAVYWLVLITLGPSTYTTYTFSLLVLRNTTMNERCKYGCLLFPHTHQQLMFCVMNS